MKCKLLKLNNDFSSLKDVNRILFTSDGYTEEMKISEKEKVGMSFEERNFFFKWINYDEFDGREQSIMLPNIEDTKNNRKISYLVKTAKCEYTKRKRRDDNGELLPKEYRLNLAFVKVIFIVIESSVYSIICENYDYNVVRAINLIGQNNIENNKNVSISPEMFNWLFYKYLRKNGVLSNDLKLDNITGFKGNIIDEHDVFEGESDQTADLIITKAFISNGYPVRNMKIVITSDEGQLFFLLDEFSNVKIGRKSYINLLFNNENDDITIPIYLYSFIIPKLSYIYERISDKFNKNDKFKFSFEVGKDVIESIAHNNDMNLIVRSKAISKSKMGHSSVHNRIGINLKKSKFY